MEFIDLKAQYASYQEEIDAVIHEVVKHAEFIGGRYVDLFEGELSDYVGRKHCVACGNGTDALQLAYMALGIGPGDAVFCPDMTFVASVEPAVMLGAIPVFCDIDPVSYNLSPSELKRQIMRVESEGRLHPKAVVAVDFLGNPADYNQLKAICSEHNLVLIEDAAQGIGGKCKGKPLGSFGDIATTSFFPSKPLGCYGDGGAVFADDDEIAALIRSLRVHGKGASKYDNVRIGVNSRLDNLQAAILHVKLAHLEGEMRARQEIAKRYDEALGSMIQYPVVDSDCRSAYAQYILVAEDGETRSRIVGSLKERKVPSLLYYPRPLHVMKVFGSMSDEDYPVATGYAARNLGLPFSPFLSQADQDAVIEAVCRAL